MFLESYLANHRQALASQQDTDEASAFKGGGFRLLVFSFDLHYLASWMLIILIQLLTIGMNPISMPASVPDARLRRLDSYVEGLGVG